MTKQEWLAWIIGILMGWGFGWVFPSLFFWIREKLLKRLKYNVIVCSSGTIVYYNPETKKWEELKDEF